MKKEIFDGIVDGLQEAIRFAKGENTGATISTYENGKKIDPKAIREKQKLSQSKFAKEYGLNLNTLKNWEHGTRTMDTASIILFRAIEQYPEIIKKVAKSL